MDIKNEKNDFSKLCEKINDETLKSRVISAGNWYIEKAFVYKIEFYVFSILGIVMPLLSVVASSISTNDGARIVTIICSAFASLSASMLALLKCRDKWTLYRMAIECMKRKLSLHWAKKLNDSDLADLIAELEKCIENEQKEWKILNSNTESAKNSNTNSNTALDNNA